MIITKSIHIDAPSDVVWAVTRDVERWPEWTPTVTSVRLADDRELGPGSVARIKQPMQPESEWVVTEFRDGERFAWETRRPGLHMVGTHELAAAGTGTRNVLTLEATGVIAVIFRPLLGWAVRKALADENRGLKVRCEQESSAGAEL